MVTCESSLITLNLAFKHHPIRPLTFTHLWAWDAFTLFGKLRLKLCLRLWLYSSIPRAHFEPLLSFCYPCSHDLPYIITSTSNTTLLCL